MSDAPELLPCPFCGCRPRMSVFAEPFGGMQIECETVNCPASNVTTGTALFDVLIPWEAWNTRAPDPRVAALIEAAEYILDGMGIDGPDYAIDPDDEFLDAANSKWVRDVLTRLAAALRPQK